VFHEKRIKMIGFFIQNGVLGICRAGDKPIFAKM